jgi:hypothetical protein
MTFAIVDTSTDTEKLRENLVRMRNTMAAPSPIHRNAMTLPAPSLIQFIIQMCYNCSNEQEEKEKIPVNTTKI